eukprot:Skav210071  [mRNA]  locus=scaffold485:216740:219896:+ [translate_table: standard]
MTLCLCLEQLKHGETMRIHGRKLMDCRAVQCSAGFDEISYVPFEVDHYAQNTQVSNPDAVALRQAIQVSLKKERAKWGEKGGPRWNRAAHDTSPLISEVAIPGPFEEKPVVDWGLRLKAAVAGAVAVQEHHTTRTNRGWRDSAAAEVKEKVVDKPKEATLDPNAATFTWEFGSGVVGVCRCSVIVQDARPKPEKPNESVEKGRFRGHERRQGAPQLFATTLSRSPRKCFTLEDGAMPAVQSPREQEHITSRGRVDLGRFSWDHCWLRSCLSVLSSLSDFGSLDQLAGLAWKAPMVKLVDEPFRSLGLDSQGTAAAKANASDAIHASPQEPRSDYKVVEQFDA